MTFWQSHRYIKIFSYKFYYKKAWLDKHNPEVGGYYVAYGDGYYSFSPAKAFEDGYTLIDAASENLPLPEESGVTGA